jgi:S-adenosylmethionine:tRNA ribosyltransferase-isomerase
MSGHEMHEEYFEVSPACIQDLLHYTVHRIPITVTGTTTLRAVESCYWLGVKLILQPDLPVEQWVVHQWDPYNLEKENIPVQAALKALEEKISGDRLIARTQLLIAPGYRFKIPNALITNFHQPQSTLLLLVAAFAGEDWRKIYRYALDNEFRFLSYGDGCLLFRSF